MRSTRNKIIRAARLLFNENGVANISQRDICTHIAISPGNLTYHFKKRNDIIETLYFELSEALQTIFENANKKEKNLASLLDLTYTINKILFENRFFMIDFIYVLRTNKTIEKDYRLLSKTRSNQFTDFINELVNDGVMQKAELPNEYDHLFTRMHVFGDFWIASVRATEKEIMLKHTRNYTEAYMQSIFPYLTATGKTEFKKLMEYN